VGVLFWAGSFVVVLCPDSFGDTVTLRLLLVLAVDSFLTFLLRLQLPHLICYLYSKMVLPVMDFSMLQIILLVLQ
jgi:hypothetical protein